MHSIVRTNKFCTTMHRPIHQSDRIHGLLSVQDALGPKARTQSPNWNASPDAMQQKIERCCCCLASCRCWNESPVIDALFASARQPTEEMWLAIVDSSRVVVAVVVCVAADWPPLLRLPISMSQCQSNIPVRLLPQRPTVQSPNPTYCHHCRDWMTNCDSVHCCCCCDCYWCFSCFLSIDSVRLAIGALRTIPKSKLRLHHRRAARNASRRHRRLQVVETLCVVVN